jgi:hypothetical protein
MYFHELLARNPLQMITVIQSDINVKWFSLGKGDESEKNTFSVPNYLPSNLLKIY